MRDKKIQKYIKSTESTSQVQSSQVVNHRNVLERVLIQQWIFFLRPRWFRPGMVFLGFLAQPQHLEVLSLTDYKRLMTEMPEALKALRGNTMKTNESAAIKSRSREILDRRQRSAP